MRPCWPWVDSVRGELFPHSDVDLLILTVAQPEPRVLRAIEAFAACLWDVGLKPGMAVRDAGACFALAEQDLSVYTSLSGCASSRWIAIAERRPARIRAGVDALDCA
jgi:[protein-PII] uridylyltransferase